MVIPISREELLMQADDMHFTKDVNFLTDDEKLVEKYINGLRAEMIEDELVHLDEYYAGKAKIQNKELHNLIKKMPKGGNLHLHST